MEAFLYQQHQPNFFLDPAAAYNYNINPSSPIEISLLPHHHQAAAGELSNASSCFTSYNSIPTSSLDAVPPPHEAEPQLSLDNKRKQSDGSCMSTGQSKGAKESKSRRKKPNGALKPKATNEVVKATKASNHEEPPSGYIHVRARRGQATDSHSLAERMRRERISERMKKLQDLVPGCDKVIGKALVLDEIINYVQSLQNQVEFLSMKLAPVNSILYDFGEDFEDYMRQPEGIGSISQAMPSEIQNSHIPLTAFDGSITNSLQQDPAAPFLLHGQGPSPLTTGTTTFSQISGSYQMQVELNGMCPRKNICKLQYCDQ